jgi:hypothetical protein
MKARGLAPTRQMAGAQAAAARYSAVDSSAWKTTRNLQARRLTSIQAISKSRNEFVIKPIASEN